MNIFAASNAYISDSVLMAWAVLICAFIVLAKCADVFVDSSVGLAERFKIPKLIIGVVLVSLATTAPELSVSLIAAFGDNPEMAMGNAVGSVICNSGLAMGLAGLVAASAIVVKPKELKISGLFLIIVVVAFSILVFPDHTLSRWEGATLVALFFAYIIFLFRQYRGGPTEEESREADKGKEAAWPGKLAAMFAIALLGILLSSKFIVVCAETIALSFNIPRAVIAVTLVAFGTSVPEVATCISAARKQEGAIAVGNILGANIMNVCWVAGASAIVNALAIGTNEFYFMFPSMFVLVIAMLGMVWVKFRLTKRKGLVLLLIYLTWAVSFFFLFPPGS